MLTVRQFLASTAVLAAFALPAAASAQTLETLPAGENTLPAWQITVKHEYPATGPNAGKPRFQGNLARVTASVKYNPTTGTYTVRDTGSVSATSSFGPAQRVAAESNATFTVYRKTVSGATQTLKVLNHGATPSAGVQMSYASYGHWRTVKPGGGNQGYTAQNDTYFVYGLKTPRNAVTSGTATYATYLDGTYVNNEKSYDVDGTGTLGANFGTGTLTFGATMTGTPSSGAALDFGTINGTGKIGSGNTAFSGKGNNGTYGMSMNGYFFGPTANEIGAVFQLVGPKGGNGDGALVGSTAAP
jgi:hypothetical protein